MAIPVYPSLSSYAGSLTEPKEVIPSILRHMFATPATSSDHYENTYDNYKLSFRRLEAEYGHHPDAVCQRLGEELAKVGHRYFPNRRLSYNVYWRMIDDSTNEPVEDNDGNMRFVRYTVFIDITEKDDEGNIYPVILSDLVSVDPKTHVFTIKFEGARYV